jgi:hypothetical protein
MPLIRRFASLVVMGLLLLPAVTRGQGGMANGLNYAGDISVAGEIDTGRSPRRPATTSRRHRRVGPDTAFVP